MEVLKAFDSFTTSEAPSKPLNQKDSLLQNRKDRLLFRQGTIAPSPKRLSRETHLSRHSTTTSSVSHKGLAPASTIRTAVSQWFTKSKKPSIPCPQFQAFLFNVHCSTCTARNATRHYSAQTMCPFQIGFQTADGRSGYILLEGGAAPADEVKEMRRKIGKRMRMSGGEEVGKRVLSLDLCGYSRMATRANEVLGQWMVDSYVAMDLGSGGLSGELVDVGGMERALREAGVKYMWEMKKESGVLG